MRLVATIRGAVQGVGFRPFVYRLAMADGLAGWVRNSPEGVIVEAEGPPALLQSFLARLTADAPPAARITGVESAILDPTGYTGFEILASETAGVRVTPLLPDIGICRDCIADISDPSNRRHRYAFTNCTNCGPRFTIVTGLPYDRPSTTMAGFEMCDACRAEYEDPTDRRFHAQPVACPACGPRLALWDSRGATVADGDPALEACVGMVQMGRIVAIKGLGGFQLICLAGNDHAVQLLRIRKHREEKPFAVMVRDAAQADAICRLSQAERRVLCSPEAPILLAVRADGPGGICDSVAPGCRELGVMLPYTPLHWLLMQAIGQPIVATSGNRTDEPICIDEAVALEALGGIADAYLVHDRPIARHADDSIVRVVAGRESVLRRARGYAPYPVRLRDPAPGVTVAFGTHLKNTTALAIGDQCYLGQHIGDLDTPSAIRANLTSARDLPRIYEVAPSVAVSDLHPDYASTQAAAASGLHHFQVQHHYAHALACMAENEIPSPFLAVVWDGTGYGADGTAWGGEFLVVDDRGYRRAGHLRPFPLPGGDAAAREPRRSAVGAISSALPDLLKECSKTLEAFTAQELRVITRALGRSLNCPMTTAAGRLFDAAASLCGLRHVARYEGQAAMELEHQAHLGSLSAGPYPLCVRRRADTLEMDWAPALAATVEDVRTGRPIPDIARAFHLGLVAGIVAVVEALGLERVALSGGCFQNRLLVEAVVTTLEQGGRRVYRHQRVPTNDGGLALGQVVGAIRQSRSGGN